MRFYWLINRVPSLISGPTFISKVEYWEKIYSSEQTNFSYASISGNIPTANAVHHEVLWEFLQLHGIHARIISLMTGLYCESESVVKCEGSISSFFPMNMGVRKGCILDPSLFITCIDWVLGKAGEQNHILEQLLAIPGFY